MIGKGEVARLELSREDMRALGYHAIDLLVDHWSGLADRPAAVDVGPEALRAKFREPVPDEGVGWKDAIAFAQENIFDCMCHVSHPRFLAFVPGPSNFVSSVADALVSGYNAPASLWRESPGAAECELVTLDWVRQLVGLESHADGIFTSGGSVANLIGLAAARHKMLGEETANAVVYCTDQTHGCVARALGVLGFRRGLIRVVGVDDSFRMDLGHLQLVIARDLAAGRRPFCIVANAGTTNTGAVDDLDALSDLAARHRLWLHVDGAYGAAAALVDPGRVMLAGMARADSVVIDPHKWLFQPYEAGICFVRERGLLQRTFADSPEYLQDVVEGNQEVNFCERGLQLTRHLRAFKLWLSLKVFGADAFRAAVQRGIDTAERAAFMLRATCRFEIVSGPQLGVLTFRLTDDALCKSAVDRLQRRIVDALIADGFAFVTSTELAGRTCLRFCTINPRIEEDDLAGTIERIIRFGDAVSRETLARESTS